MKQFSFLSLIVFSVLALAPIVSAQSGRLAVINTQAFREPGTGITKYVNAVKSVDAEFSPAIREIETLGARLQTLDSEIKAIQKALQKSGNTVDVQAGQRKVDQYQNLVRDYQIKEQEVTTRYNRRLTAVTEPISQLIGTALNEFAKQNGYSVILDLAQDKTGLIVMIADDKVDITKTFIAFFNARP